MSFADILKQTDLNVVYLGGPFLSATDSVDRMTVALDVAESEPETFDVLEPQHWLDEWDVDVRLFFGVVGIEGFLNVPDPEELLPDHGSNVVNKGFLRVDIRA